MDAIADRTDEEKKLLEERKQLLVAAYVDELDKKSSFYSDIGSGKYRSFIRRNETIKRLVQEVLQDA